MPGSADDSRVRTAAFQWLDQQIMDHGDVLPRTLLARGFELDGHRVPLLSAQGIFKPAVLSDAALSITTTTNSPYRDQIGADGFLHYSYRGANADHHENVYVRNAMQRRLPLIYFHAVVPGQYVPVYPTFVVGDDRSSLTFQIVVDDARYLNTTLAAGVDTINESEEQGRREYLTVVTMQRLHQRAFRERVLKAYRNQCALCRLRHPELLDAAHIVPDTDEGGAAATDNGLALCKIHHAAFDRMFIGIRPDYVVIVRPDILEESDGPMLAHGLQGTHESRLDVPRSRGDRPNPTKLEYRYERFVESL